jgi:hypothetical protein
MVKCTPFVVDLNLKIKMDAGALWKIKNHTGFLNPVWLVQDFALVDTIIIYLAESYINNGQVNSGVEKYP